MIIHKIFTSTNKNARNLTFYLAIQSIYKVSDNSISSGVKMLVISFAVAEKQSNHLLISVPSNIEVEV